MRENDGIKRPSYAACLILSLVANNTECASSYITATSRTINTRNTLFQRKVSVRKRKESCQYRHHVCLSMSSENRNEVREFIDASILEKNEEELDEDEKRELMPTVRKRDVVRDLVRNLASLSLKDYKWRSELFKRQEADRNEEEVLAIMRGETPSYVRPKDAGQGRRGPLGEAEESAVQWLQEVFEAEAKRAQKIVDGDGNFVRPIDASEGPLADLEQRAVTFLRSITDSETERIVLGKIRPMDLEADKRGPLGNAEEKFVKKLNEISESEKLRAAQSKQRGGEIVRPIDVPGPLGEFEKAILDIVEAERQRAKYRQESGQLVRPKDSKLVGPLGEAEREAVDTINKIRDEEYERLRALRQSLEENRPMTASQGSPLAFLESIFVGVFRAPELLMKVYDRVNELLASETLSKKDSKTLPHKDDGEKA